MNTTQKWTLFIGLVLIAFILVCGYAYPKHADADHHATGCEWTIEAVSLEIDKYYRNELSIDEIHGIIDDYLDSYFSMPCPGIEAEATPTPTPQPEATPTPTPMPMKSGWELMPTPSPKYVTANCGYYGGGAMGQTCIYKVISPDNQLVFVAVCPPKTNCSYKD